MPKINKRNQFKTLKWECSQSGLWICRSEVLKGQVVGFAHKLKDFGGWWAIAWPVSYFTHSSSFQVSKWGMPVCMHFSKLEKARVWVKRVNVSNPG